MEDYSLFFEEGVCGQTKKNPAIIAPNMSMNIWPYAYKGVNDFKARNAEIGQKILYTFKMQTWSLAV